MLLNGRLLLHSGFRTSSSRATSIHIVSYSARILPTSRTTSLLRLFNCQRKTPQLTRQLTMPRRANSVVLDPFPAKLKFRFESITKEKSTERAICHRIRILSLQKHRQVMCLFLITQNTRLFLTTHEDATQSFVSKAIQRRDTDFLGMQTRFKKSYKNEVIFYAIIDENLQKKNNYFSGRICSICIRRSYNLPVGHSRRT